MQADIRLLLRLLRRTLFHSRDSFARWTPKRCLIMSTYIPMFCMAQAFHWIGFLIDNVLFRGYRDVEIKEPIFIVGIPRSGTTLLHRLMTSDTESTTAIALWELMFAPSITERKIWMAVGALDRMLGAPGRKLLGRINARIAKRVSRFHTLSLFEPEEDEMLLVPLFSSWVLLFPFPFPEELWRFVHFDTEIGPADKDRIMGFYKACVQRHLYVHGPEKRFVSKNPIFSSKIDAINATFPDAKLICNVRNPCEAIPSLMSLFTFAWGTFGNTLLRDGVRDLVLDLAGYSYRHPMERLPLWPENRHAFLTYNSLKADLKKAVEDLYHRLDIEITPALTARLSEEGRAARGYKSSHSYSLDEYDLTPEGILANFTDVFDHFGFEYPQNDTNHRTSN